MSRFDSIDFSLNVSLSLTLCLSTYWEAHHLLWYASVVAILKDSDDSVAETVFSRLDWTEY